MIKEYVLVHGACHGAWCWEAVAEHLKANGHRVAAPDLPGHGRRANEHAQASVASYAQAVVDTMTREEISHGIVVGHSMSGVVIPKAAELAPERMAHLVFLAAVVVPDGGSIFESFLPQAARDMIRRLVRESGNETYQYPAEFAWARWMSDLPRDHPAVRAALPRLTPQPLRPMEEPVDLKRFFAMSVPRTYIRCLRDAAVLPDQALACAQRLGVAPIDLDAAHDVMLSAPDSLVEILEGL